MAREAQGVEEVHILWTSEGMSCDGDSVSLTAAMQPSIEEVVLGVIPGLPSVHLHNKVLAYETGEAFLQAFHQAARAAAMGLYGVEQALQCVRAGDVKVFQDFDVPDEAIGCGFHEAVRGVLSHHLVIRDGKIANYHPYPPTPWNASPRDIYGTPGPYEDAVQGLPLFEENGPENFKGIDIMRTVRSFDPCLPCGVHMSLGHGKVLQQVHSPTFGLGLSQGH